MLTQRQDIILNIVVGEYVATAQPVASAVVARKYPFKISPATIRNDMADLEEVGYITHPHTSAGRVPSDQGYRYYVEFLLDEVELPPANQILIRHLFHQAPPEMEEWTQLAASILSQLVRNLALVTLPRAPATRLQRLELVAVQEFLVLLLLVLQEAKLKRQMLRVEGPTSQDELNSVAHRLSDRFSGHTWAEIVPKTREIGALEGQVAEAVVGLMRAEDQSRSEEFRLEGLRHLLSQPEFGSAERVRRLVEVVEDRRSFEAIFPQFTPEDGVRVVIGGDLGQEAIQDCAMVVAPYGLPGQARGFLGVLGPTRMPYGQAVSAVRYLSGVMSELVGEVLSRRG